jgi:acetyl-CoA C-acetyltransferase
VQRQSASGLQAVTNGYWAIRCGDAGVILAGGAESMSQIPFEIRNSRYALGCEIVDAIPAQEIGAQPEERYGLLTAACVADHFTQRFCFSQGELEAFAEASLRKARAAADRGLFREEAFPVTVKRGKKEELIDRDELSKKAALLAPPADGAAMCLLASPEKAAELALPILAEILAVGVAAADPRYAAMAAAKAGIQAIDKAGLTLPEVDLIELNEMSAAECLAIMKEWQASGIEPEEFAKRINPSGGALAVGNPWGAAGAVLLTKAVHELCRRGGGVGMVVVTAEGGQGMAMVIRSNG